MILNKVKIYFKSVLRLELESNYKIFKMKQETD